MGPPRTIKPARPPSRSRFQEGSMNDRTSAAPPVHFIGAEERLLLLQQEHRQKQAEATAIDLAKLASMTERTVPVEPEPTPPPPQVSKRGSKQFLGNILGGFMEKLRGKRDATSSAAGDEDGQRKRKKGSKDQSPGGGSSSSGTNSNRSSRTDGGAELLESYDQLVAAGFFSPSLSPSTDAQPATSLQSAATAITSAGGASRPSRDEIMESYQRLVASGFFASHAIQSTRQPAPSGLSSTRPSTAVPHPASRQATPAPAPRWPLAGAPSALEPPTPLTPSKPNPSPIRSPGSASSRGTKRAAVDEDRDDSADHGRASGDSIEGSQRPPYGQQAKRKLRKTASASRDLAMPKLRSASSSRRALLSRRSFSNAFGQSQAQAAASSEPQAQGPAAAAATTAAQQPSQNTSRLSKRVLGKLQVPDRVSSTAHSGGRRNVSESHHNPMPFPSAAASSTDADAPSQRVLRSRRSAAEPLRSIRPNAIRGVPAVPDVPAKFTFGTDRENDGPWRGLRRANGGAQQQQ